MAWIESHQSLATHRKLLKLCALLSARKPTVIGHLHLLWWWCLDNAPSGDLTDIDSHIIADVMCWELDPDKLVSFLVEAGWLDDKNGKLTVHDWHDFAGKLMDRREWNAQRMREKRAAHVHRTNSERAAHVHDSVHRTCIATVQNSTVPNNTHIQSENCPVELPAGFPDTQALAEKIAEVQGVPKDVAVDAWNKAMSRGGVDAKGQPIKSFGHYLRNELKYHQERIFKEKQNATNRTINQRSPSRNVGTANANANAEAYERASDIRVV